MMNAGGAYQGQKVRAIITACDPSTRLVHGRFKDGGSTSIAVFEIGSAFRWPQVGEVWTVSRQNNYWILGSRVNNDQFEPFPVTGLSTDPDLRLDGTTIFDANGEQLVAVSTSGIQQGFSPQWSTTTSGWTLGPTINQIPIEPGTPAGVTFFSSNITTNNTSITPVWGTSSDVQNGMIASAGGLTVPITGLYMIGVSMRGDMSSGYRQLTLTVGGGSIDASLSTETAPSSSRCSILYPISAGQVVTALVYSSTTCTWFGTSSWTNALWATYIK